MKKILVSIFFLLIFIKYSLGENLTKDDLLKMSPSQIIISAKNGDPLAQLWLGDAVFNGSIPNWKSFNACELYYKSAEQNNAEASFKLYELLRLFSRDCPERINFKKPNLSREFWLLKAARLNNPKAQLNLYYDSKSDTTKLRWLKKAVENNNSRAVGILASLYLSGNKVEKNIKKAIELFHKSSKLNPKYEYPDRELSKIYSNKVYLHEMFKYKNRKNNGEIDKIDDKTAKILKRYDYSNYFDIEKAISSAKTCIQKQPSFSCYMYLIDFYSDKRYGNINFDEALFWLDEAEVVLKDDNYYNTILTTKAFAYMTWDNLKFNKLKAREYFLKAIENVKISKYHSKEERINEIQKWLEYYTN